MRAEVSLGVKSQKIVKGMVVSLILFFQTHHTKMSLGVKIQKIVGMTVKLNLSSRGK